MSLTPLVWNDGLERDLDSTLTTAVLEVGSANCIVCGVARKQATFKRFVYYEIAIEDLETCNKPNKSAYGSDKEQNDFAAQTEIKSGDRDCQQADNKSASYPERC